MNQKIKIVVVVLFFSCSNLSKEKKPSQLLDTGRAVHVSLVDSLGSVSLFLPSRYDTGFYWIHYSDCGKPCDEQEYRFQSKTLPLIKESGWIWSGPKDSIDRFTISHGADVRFQHDDTAINDVKNIHIKEELMDELLNPPIVFDTIQKIDNRYFSIIVMERSDSMQSRKVLAVTTFRHNEVKFMFELLIRKNDSVSLNFVKNSIDYLKTIRLSKSL